MTTQLPAGRSKRPPRGRPRDPRIEPAVLKATRALLAEEGWSRFSVTEVARRAGVTKPALYRRWPSRGALVYDALFTSGAEGLPVPDTGSMRNDLRVGLRSLADMFASNEGGTGGRAILSELVGGTPEIRARFREERFGRDYERVAEMFRRGEARGEAHLPLSPELLTELLLDWVSSRCLLRDAPPSDEEIGQVLDTLLGPSSEGAHDDGDER